MFFQKPNNRNNDKSGKSDKYNGENKFKCYKCGKLGHKASKCWSKAKSEQNKNKTENASLYATLVSNENHKMNTALICSTSEKRWCLDSGCTTHMVKNTDNFKWIDENVSETLNLANSSSTKISAKGAVELVTRMNNNDKTINLSEVLHVPDLRTNLLSVGKIVDKGYRVTFDKYKAEVINKFDNSVILRAD